MKYTGITFIFIANMFGLEKDLLPTKSRVNSRSGKGMAGFKGRKVEPTWRDRGGGIRTATGLTITRASWSCHPGSLQHRGEMADGLLENCKDRFIRSTWHSFIRRILHTVNNNRDYLKDKVKYLKAIHKMKPCVSCKYLLCVIPWGNPYQSDPGRETIL